MFSWRIFATPAGVFFKTLENLSRSPCGVNAVAAATAVFINLYLHLFSSFLATTFFILDKP